MYVLLSAGTHAEPLYQFIMSPAHTLQNNNYEVCEIRTHDTSFGGHMAVPTSLQGHVIMLRSRNFELCFTQGKS